MLFALPTLLGACLLFAVEPMLAKWLLPAFGGSPATWLACLATYQVLLLAGYVYAHALAGLPLRAQARLHGGLAVAAAGWALTVGLGGVPEVGDAPTALGVAGVLSLRVGLPFVVLASTAPLLQSWAVAGGRRGDHRLYALSNGGSLVGLFAYPFVLEPWLRVSAQRALWAGAFAVYAAATIAVALRVHRDGAASLPTSDAPPSAAPPAVGPVAFAPTSGGGTPRWFVLAAVPSALLMAASQHLTVDVAAAPLLWVVPLALYLGTFILAFGGAGERLRWPALIVWTSGALGVGLDALRAGSAPLVAQVGAALLALAGAGLLCHGELARERPGGPALTRFYLAIAAGGAAGGAAVSFVAPLVFADYYELELAALATFAVLLIPVPRATRAETGPAHAPRAKAASSTAPRVKPERRALWLAAGLCVPLLVASLAARSAAAFGTGRIVARSRSFLGPLRVVDLPAGRVLTHGRSLHGMQLRGARAGEPTLYFASGTALGGVLGERRDGEPLRVGVVGLGIGTIAAYGRVGDHFRFYELDPAVVALARSEFTFLASSRADIEVLSGDGRRSLAAEPPQGFDVLVLDAFTSDAVPIHLVTRDAFGEYLRHLDADGLLLVNVSNRHLAVDRAVVGAAHALGLRAAVVESEARAGDAAGHVVWALLARTQDTLDAALRRTGPPRPTGADVVFTDQRASLLAILR